MTVKQKNYIFIGGTIIAVMFGYTYFLQQQKEFNAITSFKECIDAGYEVTITYPEECRIPGKKFINPHQTSKKVLTQEKETAANSFKDSTYVIDGQPILFNNGKGELILLQGKSSSTSILQQTNTVLVVDINNDTKDDTIFLIQNISVPSKDLYISASLSLYNGLTGVNGIYIGKNITNAKLTYAESKITLEYILQNSKEKLFKYYKLENGILKEYN